MSRQPYHDLILWKEAYSFSLEAYKASTGFPSEERYGITSQLRRAAVSVVLNIVEGHGKKTAKDFLRFLDTAKGSLRECAVLLEYCRDLNYLAAEDFDRLDGHHNRVSYLLNNFTRAVRQKS